MRSFGLPWIGMIEMKRCNIKTHIHSPTRGLVKKVSCHLLYGFFGCKKCSKVNNKHFLEYVKKHNLHWNVSEGKMSLWQRTPIGDYGRTFS